MTDSFILDLRAQYMPEVNHLVQNSVNTYLIENKFCD